MNPLVSIVLPVYNMEKYIENSINSIINQTYKNIEVIFVDDGSSDRTVEIIKKYQEIDDRIILFVEEHKNAASARNMGMDNSHGQYILFWDADDIYDKDAVSFCVSQMQESDCPILVYSFFEFSKKLNYKKKNNRIVKNIYIPRNDSKHIFEKVGAVPWNKMFLREYIYEKNLRWQNIPKNEDVYFSYMSAMEAEKILIVKSNPLYFYRLSEGNTAIQKRMETCIDKVFKELYVKMKEKHIFEIYAEAFYSFVIKTSNQLKNVDNMDQYMFFFDMSKRIFADVDLLHYDGLKQSSYYDLVKCICEGKVSDSLFILYKEKSLEMDILKRNTISKQTKTYKIGRMFVGPIEKLIGR